MLENQPAHLLQKAQPSFIKWRKPESRNSGTPCNPQMTSNQVRSRLKLALAQRHLRIPPGILIWGTKKHGFFSLRMLCVAWSSPPYYLKPLHWKRSSGQQVLSCQWLCYLDIGCRESTTRSWGRGRHSWTGLTAQLDRTDVRTEGTSSCRMYTQGR